MPIVVCQSCAEVLANCETEDAQFEPLSEMNLDEGESLVVDFESGHFRDWVSCFTCPMGLAGDYFDAEVIGN